MDTPIILRARGTVGKSFLESTSLPSDVDGSGDGSNQIDDNTLQHLNISPVRQIPLDDNGNPIMSATTTPELIRQLDANQTLDMFYKQLPVTDVTNDLFGSSIDSLSHRIRSYFKASNKSIVDHINADYNLNQPQQQPEPRRITFKDPIQEVKSITPASPIVLDETTFSTFEQQSDSRISFSDIPSYENESTLKEIDQRDEIVSSPVEMHPSLFDPYELLQQADQILQQIQSVKDGERVSFNETLSDGSSRSIVDGSSMFAKSNSVETVKSFESIQSPKESNNTFLKSSKTISPKLSQNSFQECPVNVRQNISPKSVNTEASKTTSSKLNFIARESNINISPKTINSNIPSTSKQMSTSDLLEDLANDSEDTEYLPMEDLNAKYANMTEVFKKQIESLKANHLQAKQQASTFTRNSQPYHSTTEQDNLEDFITDSDTNQVSGSVVLDSTAGDFLTQLYTLQREVARLEKEFRQSRKERKKKERNKGSEDRDGRTTKRGRSAREEDGWTDDARNYHTQCQHRHGDRHQQQHGKQHRAKELYCQHLQLGRQLNRIQSDPLLATGGGHCRCGHNKHKMAIDDTEDDHLFYHLQHLDLNNGADNELHRNYICNYEDLMDYDRRRPRRPEYQPYKPSPSPTKIIDRSVQTSIIIDNPAPSPVVTTKVCNTPEMLQERRSPVSWFVTVGEEVPIFAKRAGPSYFAETSNRYLDSAQSNNRHSSSSGSSLHDAFHRSCRRFERQSQLRLERIKINTHLRIATADQRRREIEKVSQASQKKETLNNSRRSNKAATSKQQTRQSRPRPLSPATRPVLTHREMRERTERIYRKLPEVKAKIVDTQREDEARTRRMMAEVFKQKLKEAAVRGRVNFPITKLAINT